MFSVKMILMPIVGLALFIWCLVAAHGFGPIFNQKTNITSGRTVAFAFFSGVNSVIGPEATFALNMSDLCRFGKSPRAGLIAQTIMMPICLTLTAFLGVTLASSSAVIYHLDQPEWNPLVVVGMFQSRAAQFFVALLFAFATLCTNIAGNSIAFGNDLASLFPRYINIRRGQFLCAILGVCVTPWNILSSSTNLLNFLNGYGVFLGPVCGIMLTDYWILRERRLNLQHLFEPHGIYWFAGGVNWRAAVAFLASIVPTLPGLVASVNSSVSVPEGFQSVYTMSWLVGLVIAGCLYYGLSIAFPVPGADEAYPPNLAEAWLMSASTSDLIQESVSIKGSVIVNETDVEK
jgi:NCS1 family nucleobase:cation symporter-1